MQQLVRIPVKFYILKFQKIRTNVGTSRTEFFLSSRGNAESLKKRFL